MIRTASIFKTGSTLQCPNASQPIVTCNILDYCKHLLLSLVFTMYFTKLSARACKEYIFYKEQFRKKIKSRFLFV